MARKGLLYGLALVILVAAPLYVPPYELSLLGRFLALAIAALGISLVWGTAGMLSLGQGVFFAIGGYAIAIHLKLANADAGQLTESARRKGMRNLREDGWDKIRLGVTTPAEVTRVTQDI